MSNTNSSAGTSGRARSCTGCRQVKLACDARRTAPQSCTRCKNKGLQCRFDSNFRRIPMRRVAQEITNGIHKLLPADTAEAEPTPERKTPSQTGSVRASASPLPPTSVAGSVNANLHQTLRSFESARPWLHVSDQDIYGRYVLGSVELDGETVIDLFKHFERNYLKHTPFLENIESLYGLASRSPILFWTIVMTAAREHIVYGHVYEQICLAHGVLLSQITHIAIQTIEEIHALLLLCLWAIPKQRNMHDPAWNYIGTAINAAMQLGCHDPLPADSIASSWKGTSDLSSADLSKETAALTWIHCFQIGARLAANHGLPPPLATQSQLRSVKRAVDSLGTSISEEQKAMNEILRVACLSTSEVDSTDGPQARYSLIDMFDEHFNKIKTSYEQYWTSELDIELLSCKLNLYGLLLVVQSTTPNEFHQVLINQQVILLRAQDTAFRLASRMTKLSNTPADDGIYLAGTLTFYPKYYFQSLMMAVVFLFRFLASYQGTTQQHTLTVIGGLTEAHKVFQSFPEHRDAFKAAIQIQTLAEIIRSTDGAHPCPLNELIITNRLGHSLVLDALFRTAYRRNKNSGTSASPPSDWYMLGDDPRQRIPLTPEALAATSGTGSSNYGNEDEQDQMMGPWGNWDSYMSDFLVEGNLDQWTNEALTQIDASTRAQMYDAATASTLPILGQTQFMG